MGGRSACVSVFVCACACACMPVCLQACVALQGLLQEGLWEGRVKADARRIPFASGGRGGSSYALRVQTHLDGDREFKESMMLWQSAIDNIRGQLEMRLGLEMAAPGSGKLHAEGISEQANKIIWSSPGRDRYIQCGLCGSLVSWLRPRFRRNAKEVSKDS